MHPRSRVSLVSLVLVVIGCGGPPANPGRDAATRDAHADVDAATLDGDVDAAAVDAAVLDGAPVDVGLDGGALDLAAEAARICDLWTRNECERRELCNELGTRSLAECVSSVGRFCAPAFEAALALAESGDATYDEALVDVCTLPLPACGAFQTAAEACRGILIGARADDASCSAPLGGLAGTCATGNCRPEGSLCATCIARPAIGAACQIFERERACADGAVCMSSGASGVCVARAALDAACSRGPFGGVDPCAAGLVCSAAGTCVDPPALGEPCTDRCEAGSRCDEGVCGPALHFREEGDACGGDFECPMGIRCLPPSGGGASVCRPASALDEACQPRGCSDGLFCNVSGASTCRPYPGGSLGAACDVAVCPIEAGECCDVDLFCDGTGHCAAPMVATAGQPCGLPEIACAPPGLCDASGGTGICVGYVAEGGTCAAQRDCQPGLDCTGSTCMPRPPITCP